MLSSVWVYRPRHCEIELHRTVMSFHCCPLVSLHRSNCACSLYMAFVRTYVFRFVQGVPFHEPSWFISEFCIVRSHLMSCSKWCFYGKCPSLRLTSHKYRELPISESIAPEGIVERNTAENPFGCSIFGSGPRLLMETDWIRPKTTRMCIIRYIWWVRFVTRAVNCSVNRFHLRWHISLFTI